jgi:hypothetical protein
MRRHLLTIGLILIGATGCDNVGWGGVEWAVMPPPTAPVDPDTDTTTVVEEATLNVDHPILLAGIRDGARATLTVVGEVEGDALTPFPDPRFDSDLERLATLTAPGAEWILFSEGVRVGRLVADQAGTSTGFCGSPVTISGMVELVPSAATVERLLALPAADAGDRAYGEYLELQDDYDQRVASLEIAQAAIPEYGATWPREGVLDARKHIQAFDVSGTPGPFIAATFLYQDNLAVGPPGPDAYSLFVVGEEVSGTHRGVYTWYRSVDPDGKGAPRYFDHLDWNGDGSEEVLLDVLGPNRRWFAVLARRDGAWVRTFQDACGTGGSTVGD